MERGSIESIFLSTPSKLKETTRLLDTFIVVEKGRRDGRRNALRGEVDVEHHSQESQYRFETIPATQIGQAEASNREDHSQHIEQ